MSQQRFKDKVVIITGSSAGIGQDAAIEFAKECASVVIHGQNAERLDKTEETLLNLSVSSNRILKVIGPMELPETCEKIVKETLEKFGKIDVLINNAGAAGKPGEKDMFSLEQLDYLYAVNFRSVVQLTQLAYPHLKKTKGNIVNVSSAAAVRPMIPYHFYSALKAALDSYAKSCAQLYGSYGVRVNNLNPGVIETYINERNGIVGEEKQEIQKIVEEELTVLKRVGQCSEMSSVLKFLASDEASYMTGTCLLADGGFAVASPDFPIMKLIQKSL